DVRQESLDEPSKAEFYEPISRMPMTFLTIVTHTEVPGTSAFGAIRNVVGNGDPAAVLSTLTRLRELVGDTISTRRLALTLMLLFAGLAVCGKSKLDGSR